MKNIIFAISILALLLVAGCTTEGPIVEKSEDFCNTDSDCVPFPECHPMSCINKDFTDNYEKPEICTMMYLEEAAYNPEDCACVDNECINKNKDKNNEITNFEECVAAGNPVMESYPRQCRANGQTYVETIEHHCTEEEKNAQICTMDYTPVCGDNDKTYGNACSACASGEIEYWTQGECESLTIEEAIDIAEQSECLQEGQLTDEYFYNEYTKTWWINLDTEKEGCSPACVVYEETKTAEINWRCTGLLPS